MKIFDLKISESTRSVQSVTYHLELCKIYTMSLNIRGNQIPYTKYMKIKRELFKCQ